MAPKGRDEEGIQPHAMAWVRHHDKYVDNKLVDAISILSANKA
jgi:hypothetical protein